MKTCLYVYNGHITVGHLTFRPPRTTCPFFKTAHHGTTELKNMKYRT